MNGDIYIKLGNRINENFMKLPLVEPVLVFLRKIFTEQQAEIAANIPIGSHTLRELSELLNRDPDELYPVLDHMADNGLVFIHKNNDGEEAFSVPPFFPGLVEFQTMRGGEGEKDIEIASAIKEMMDYLEELAQDLYKDPDKANKIIPSSLRTLTVETELPQDKTVMPFEQVSAIISDETSFAAGHCHCRHQAKLTGTPCQIEGLPERNCFYFGNAADFMVERKFAKRVTKEECLDILKQSEAAGLVHNINNYLGKSLVLCNCCSCCCDFLGRMKKYRGLKSVARSNFIVHLDVENCIGCGLCICRCQMEALSLDDDDKVTLEESYCIGCGNCVTTCPENALKMIRHSDKEPPTLKRDFPGLGV